MPCCIPFAAALELSRFSPAMPDIFIGAESGLDDMVGIFMCAESFAAGDIGGDFRVGAGLTGIGIAIVGDRSLVLTRDLLLTLVPGPGFFPALDDFAFELAAVFFF